MENNTKEVEKEKRLSDENPRQSPREVDFVIHSCETNKRGKAKSPSIAKDFKDHWNNPSLTFIFGRGRQNHPVTETTEGKQFCCHPKEAQEEDNEKEAKEKEEEEEENWRYRDLCTEKELKQKKLSLKKKWSGYFGVAKQSDLPLQSKLISTDLKKVANPKQSEWKDYPKESKQRGRLRWQPFGPLKQFFQRSAAFCRLILYIASASLTAFWDKSKRSLKDVGCCCSNASRKILSSLVCLTPKKVLKSLMIIGCRITPGLRSRSTILLLLRTAPSGVTKWITETYMKKVPLPLMLKQARLSLRGGPLKALLRNVVKVLHLPQMVLEILVQGVASALQMMSRSLMIISEGLTKRSRASKSFRVKPEIRIQRSFSFPLTFKTSTRNILEEDETRKEK